MVTLLNRDVRPGSEGQTTRVFQQSSKPPLRLQQRPPGLRQIRLVHDYEISRGWMPVVRVLKYFPTSLVFGESGFPRVKYACCIGGRRSSWIEPRVGAMSALQLGLERSRAYRDRDWR